MQNNSESLFPMENGPQSEILPLLNEDFIINVLPQLFNKTTLPPFHSFLSGQGPETYDLKLDIDSIFDCATDYKPTTNRFVHFTSLAALNSILSEQGLRLYNLHNVEDTKEYRLIAKEFDVSEFQLNLLKARVYICSLSPSSILDSDEVLWYWRKFGNDGMGCAIEFEIEDPIQALSHIKLANVLYSKPDISGFLSANIAFEKRHNRKTDLKSLIHLQACLHKNECYKIEKEVRLFYEDGFAEPHRACEEHYPYGFDFKNGVPVSYYKVKFYNRSIDYPNIKIKRIQFGPKIKPHDLKQYEDHFTLLFISMMNRLGVKDELPIIEHSPLVSSFH